MIARSPYSETSQVVQFLTERSGFVTALARGTYREKSSFGGPLDLVTAGQADFSSRRSSELELLHSFTLDRPYRRLRGDLRRWLAAAHVIELLRPFAWPKDRAHEIYTLAIATLDVLETAVDDATVDAALAYFGARLLLVAGFQPQLDACCSCSRPRESAGKVAFSSRFGGILCAACSARDAATVRCSPAAVDLLKRLLGASDSRAPADGNALSEVRAILDRFVEARVERKLHAGKWIQDGIPPLKKR